jgi:hypothetical protein
VEHVVQEARATAELPQAQALHELQGQEHLAVHHWLPADYAREVGK